MRTLSDTITRLAAAQTRMGQPRAGGIDRLTDMAVTGANPGQLAARIHIPEGLAPGAPLVVVLHGCTQNAAGYDHGSGWSALADEQGFALLYPEQQRGNNANLCFNWFEPGDIRRDEGEALSIRSMIVQVIAEHDLDPARVFVTGLSAGGAMTAVMLATWPELFAGGAIIAGLPYGVAAGVPQAFDRMRGHGGPAGPELAALVRKASRHDGPWPTLSVWHGTADMTVAVSNMDAIVEQWRLLHGVDAAPSQAGTVGGHATRRWTDAGGRVLIEAHSIAGMGHGTPIAPGQGCGAAMPHMLDVGICSTRAIATFWGIAEKGADARADMGADAAVDATAAASRDRTAGARPVMPAVAAMGGATEIPEVKKVIEDALRAAGLLR